MLMSYEVRISDSRNWASAKVTETILVIARDFVQATVIASEKVSLIQERLKSIGYTRAALVRVQDIKEYHTLVTGEGVENDEVEKFLDESINRYKTRVGEED